MKPVRLFGPAVALASAFALVSVLVETGVTKTGDRDALLDLHREASRPLTQTMLRVTDAGLARFVLPAAALVALGLLARRRARDALLLALAVAGAAFDPLLKWLFDRPRPHVFPHLQTVHSPSYPSGHASTSAVFAFAVAVIAWRTRLRWFVAGAAALYVLAVGFSRLYLGVHYPSDVVGGWLMAGAWVAIATATVAWAERRRNYETGCLGSGSSL